LDAGNAAILARLKELEAQNQQLQKTVEEAKSEVERREEKIKELSIEKRKEMEEFIQTAIDSWLNSLPDLTDDVKKQFRTGISRIAETADARNAAWEVVCNASKLHTANVNRIEELIATCNQQSETIKTLVGSGSTSSAVADPSFSSDASRMGGSNKRPRTDADPAPSAITTASSNEPQFANAWDAFGDLLKKDGRAQYGW
jgi:chromosome segregation ATPase